MTATRSGRTNFAAGSASPIGSPDRPAAISWGCSNEREDHVSTMTWNHFEAEILFLNPADVPRAVEVLAAVGCEFEIDHDAIDDHGPTVFGWATGTTALAKTTSATGCSRLSIRSAAMSFSGALSGRLRLRNTRSVETSHEAPHCPGTEAHRRRASHAQLARLASRAIEGGARRSAPRRHGAAHG